MEADLENSEGQGEGQSHDDEEGLVKRLVEEHSDSRTKVR